MGAVDGTGSGSYVVGRWQAIDEFARSVVWDSLLMD